MAAARRAQDLSRVLDAYTRMMDIFDGVSQVSSTEASLARGLRDAAALAIGTQAAPPVKTQIQDGDRLRAMDVIQYERVPHRCNRAVITKSAILDLVISARVLTMG